MAKITVLGAGSWGTAMALQLRRTHSVTLWARRPAAVEAMRSDGENRDYLPGHPLDGIRLTAEGADALADAEIALIAVPSKHLAETLTALAPHARPALIPVSLAKGFQTGGGFRTMTEVIAATWPAAGAPVVVSGPSHAEEVAAGLPTALVAASADAARTRTVRDALLGESMRVYGNDDPRGVEIGGALKNIIAIAAGIAGALGLGDNSFAALLTRGMAEMVRLGEALGAQPRTFYGLAGMGDLIGTCGSKHSRNRKVGERLGRGETWAAIEADMRMVAEGVWAARAVHEFARARGLSMPITEAVHDVLFENRSSRTAVLDLMGREAKDE